MSHVTDLVEAEAQRAESEPDDDEPTPDDDEDDLPPEEVEPEQAMPDLPTFDPKRLEAEQRRHEKALAGIFGSLDTFDACEECGALGFVPQALRDAPKPQPHPDYRRCETCQGFGMMATGSLRESYDTRPCPTCAGNGYMDRMQEEALQRAQQLSQGHVAAPPPPPPTWDQSRGTWVDQYGNPITLGSTQPQLGYPA